MNKNKKKKKIFPGPNFHFYNEFIHKDEQLIFTHPNAPSKVKLLQEGSCVKSDLFSKFTVMNVRSSVMITA